jgi:hypothetical protein
MKRISKRLAILEFLILSDEEEEIEEEESPGLDVEKEKLIYWAKLKEELGL